MKRLLVLLFALLMCVGMVACGGLEPSDETEGSVTPQTSDIRNVLFGMSHDQVKAAESEGKIVIENEKNIAFDGIKVSGLNAVAAYYFNESDQLYQLAYLIKETHSTDNAYLSDFDKLKGGLIDKYGEPATDKVIWNRSLYKDDTDSYGFAVSIGDLEYLCLWETQNMTIIAKMNGDNYQISTNITYVSKNYDRAEGADSGL